MPRPGRKAEIALIVGFAAIIASVGVVQIALELWRGQRVQYTDLFRYRPSEKNLRQYEKSLEDNSWATALARPAMRQLSFSLLHDPGPKALAGLDGWVFYRPGVRYLLESNRPQRDGAVRAIVRFRDQLRDRGIQLLIVPVPEKASVYPDRLTRRAEGRYADFHSPTLELLEDLRGRGVESVDLFAAFREARVASGEDLYLADDTHWTPAGMKLAAAAVAEALRRLGWTPRNQREYQSKPVRVERFGDILEMMQVGNLHGRFPRQVVDCEQIIDKTAGLLVPRAGGPEGTWMNRQLREAQRPEILLLGDSFCRIYQIPEPQSLGLAPGEPQTRPSDPNRDEARASKRLLPGSAGFPSHLSLALKSAVDYIISDGGASTHVRQKLSANGEILEGKRIIIWEFTERDIGLGSEGWKEVPLPPAP